MSMSLRERLKKCGRYRPPSNSSCESPSATTQSSTDVCSPDSILLGGSGHVVHTTYTNSTDDGDTPKRRTPEALNSTTTSLAKRRKLNYSEKSVNMVDGGSQNITEVSSSPSYSTPVFGAGSQNVLGDDEKQRNENVNDDPISCPSTGGHEIPGENSLPEQSYMKLKDLKIQLDKEFKAKEEQIRKLNMVKMYREKNNLTELQKLIDTWRIVSQKALVDLHDLHPPPRPSLTELINHLQIDHKLIHYDADEETFS